MDGAIVWCEVLMDWEQTKRMCSIPTQERSLADEVWSMCRIASPAIGALMFGTADGVMTQGAKRIEENPSRAVYEGLGAAGLGVALKAAPKCIAVPAALIGGAGTMLFARDSYESVNKVIPALNNASSNPELARSNVASELGPVVFEGASMCAIGALSGLATSRINMKPTHGLRELVNVRRTCASESATVAAPAKTLLSYKLPYLGIELLVGPGAFKAAIANRTFGPIQRDAFQGAKELKLHSCNRLMKDGDRHRMVRNYDPAESQRASTSTHLAIPTLTRPFNGVRTEFTPRNRVEAKLYDGAKESIVRIRGTGVDNSTWGGTGFVVSEDGRIATALHVVSGARNVEVKTQSGIKYDASLIAQDFDSDLAILKIHPKDVLKPLALADSGRPAKHDVFVLGHPASSEALFMSPGLFHRNGLERACLGYKSESGAVYRGRPYQSTSYFAHTRSGNSGGPVLDAQGKVIAVHTDGDQHKLDYYDEVRVGSGTAVQELRKLMKTLPAGHNEPLKMWSPESHLESLQPRKMWWNFLIAP